ncbi:MAG: hypothetical protein EPN25_14100 [Nitrospirae bacterium]|nr:MAG: hypothetical protein EPN25_14100 [Nitrospirota bacterium]
MPSPSHAFPGSSTSRSARFCYALCFLIIVAAFSLTSVPSVSATEGGGGAYPNGAEDFMAGAVPPPGFYLLDYLMHYRANKLRDNSGNNIFPDFDLKVTANVYRFIYITKHQVLGGFWGMHAFVPLVNVDVTVPPVGSQSKSGVGDIIVDPFILSWHSKNWHAVTALDIYIPTGSYNRNNLANVGRNYWTFEPIAGITYVSDSGFDVSAKIMYDINTKNDDTNYTSGNEFHVDYTLAQKFGNLSVGLGGYYYKQITDDEQNGTKVSGNKGQVLAFGPQLKYDYQNMSFLLKYQTETQVRNRPDGETYWFKFVYAF